MMRKLVVSLVRAPISNRLLLLMVAALAAGCYEKSDSKETSAAGPLYRHHFAGLTQIFKGTNAAKLKEVWALKSSTDLRQQVLDKLAAAPREFWRKQLPPAATDQKDLIRPLLDDLLSAESYLEIKGPISRTEGVLAVRLGPDRLAIWNNNLAKLATAWNLGPQESTQAGNFKGWTIKRNPGVVQVMTAGEWVLVCIGQDKLTLLPALLEQAGKASRPVPALASTNLLALDTDLPRLKNWFPFLAHFKMPPIHADIAGEGEYIRTKMRMSFSSKIPWTPEPWKIPTNIISEPLAGFTVGQGIGPLLAQTKGVPQLGLKNYPNQFCSWDQALAQFLTFFSAPMPNTSNVLKQAAPKFPDLIKQYIPDAPGQIGLIGTNRVEVAWMGLPIILPFIRAYRETSGEYLVGGALPLFARSNSPPPPDLFKQFMGRNNLLYYSWEITEQSLSHCRQYAQVLDILHNRTFPSSNAPSVKWVAEAASHLGNAITEVTLTAPNELSLTRKTHLGFTGLELVLLLRWFDSPAFPFNYEPPAKIEAELERIRASRTNAPNRGAKSNPAKPALPAPTNVAKPNLQTPKPK